MNCKRCGSFTGELCPDCANQLNNDSINLNEQIIRMSHITTIQLLESRVSKKSHTFGELKDWSIDELESKRDELIDMFNLLYLS